MGNSIGMDQLGQYGSAYSDLVKPIVPPQGMVIVAIQFLAAGTPTILTPEKLDTKGPGYVSISGTTSDVVGVADNYMNFQGSAQANCDTAATYAPGDDVSVSATTGTIKVGQYVLLVLDADHEGSGITIDSETPTPIYTGPNKRGVYVTGIATNGDPQLSAQITPATNQHLIFLGPQQGAGGITAAGQVYPIGTTIYGRWTEFQNDAAAVICYFGY
jgi:hypothetical protein|tara:strand:- start:67 stop:714 length:648 start_codon:yes stop_codon:yes gene_type:complete